MRFGKRFMSAPTGGNITAARPATRRDPSAAATRTDLADGVEPEGEDWQTRLEDFRRQMRKKGLDMSRDDRDTERSDER